MHKLRRADRKARSCDHNRKYCSRHECLYHLYFYQFFRNVFFFFLIYCYITGWNGFAAIFFIVLSIHFKRSLFFIAGFHRMLINSALKVWHLEDIISRCWAILVELLHWNMQMTGGIYLSYCDTQWYFDSCFVCRVLVFVQFHFAL